MRGAPSSRGCRHSATTSSQSARSMLASASPRRRFAPDCVTAPAARRDCAQIRRPRHAHISASVLIASELKHHSGNPAIRMDSTRWVALARSLKGSFATRRVMEKSGFKFKHSLARVAARPLSASLAWQPAISAETQYPRVGKCSNAAKASSCRFTIMRARPKLDQYQGGSKYGSMSLALLKQSKAAAAWPA
jgi:hypothetical protein